MSGTWNSWRNKKRKRRFYKRKGFWLGTFGFGLILLIAGYIAWNHYTEPYRQRATTYDLERINDIEVPSIILDRDGKEIGRIFVENRSAMSFSDVPVHFTNALKAGEDSRFDEHDGVDYIGVGRAVWKLMQRGSVTQGASTITQQLARDAYGLKAEASKRKESGYQRKLVEMFLAQRIERRYQKDEILGFFVNRSFLGSGFYGLRSAALGYFGKEPQELTIPECASLVTILRNPKDLSPLNDIEANRKGRNHVIWRMKEEGMITEAQMVAFQAEDVALNPRPLQRGTSHVYEMIAAEARNMVGEDAFTKGGFVIHTTIDKKVQDVAQAALREKLTEIENRQGFQHPKYADYGKGKERPAYLQGTVMMMDHETGEVLAYVGGRDYAHSQYDIIREGRKPLGTAFFPFVTAASLANGLTPATMVEDEPMDNRMVMVGGSEGILGEWGAETERPTFHGSIPMRRALEESKIAATVRLGTSCGVDQVAETAKRFGFSMPEGDKLPRLLLGWEAASMTETLTAYAAFARGGITGPETPHFVAKIVDANKEVLQERAQVEPSRTTAVDEATAYQVHSMLQGAVQHGNLEGKINMPASFRGGVKTGTTHDFTSCWAAGYSSRVVCGAWCGFLQGSKPIYEGAFGRDLILPVWEATMKAMPMDALQGEIRKPATIVEVDVCRVSGQRAGAYCYESMTDAQTGLPKLRDARVKEFFRKGTERIPACPDHGEGTSDAHALVHRSQDLAVLDAIPVRAKEPLLLGDDPYQAEIPSGSIEKTDTGEEGAFFRSGTQDAFDRLDLGDDNAVLPLTRPGKLEIEVE